MNGSGNTSCRFNDSASKELRADLVGPEVKSLISDATKRSFRTTQYTDATSSLSSANASEKTDFVSTSSNLTCQPLLPRRHNNEHIFHYEQSQFSKWQPHMGPIQNMQSSASSLAPSSSSTLLSKVAMDDDISELMSRSSLGNVADSGDSAWSNLSATPPNWNFKAGHMIPYGQNKENIVAYNGFDPIAQGDTPFAPQSYKSSSLFETGGTDLSTNSSLAEIAQPQTVLSVQSSYVVSDPTFSSLDSARAAGFPVITKSHTDDSNKISDEIPTKKSVRSSQSLVPGKKELQASTTHNYIQWADLHHKYAQVIPSEDHSKVQVTDRFHSLLQQLEILRLESIQHNPVSQVDISKAIGLLKKAKNDILVAKSTSTIQKTGNKQLDDHKFLASPIEVPTTSKSVPAPLPSVLQQQQMYESLPTSKNIMSIAADNLPQSFTGTNSAPAISEKFKSPSEIRVHFEPPMTSTEIKPSVTSTRNYDSSYPSAGLNQNHVSKQPAKVFVSEDGMSSRRSLFPNPGSNAQNISNNESVSYDAFSANVQASSCHSTPSKSPSLQNASSKSQKDASLPADTSDNKSATGFVILDEKTPPGKLAKKKEQFLRGRLKKEEEQRHHQMEREMEAEKRKVEAKEQQEKLLQKKQEEKEKRDKVFRDYQKRKRKEEKAAQRNHGVIGAGSPANGTKKGLSSKIHSRSMERLNVFTNSELGHGSTLTVPVSSRSNYASSTHHHLHMHEEDTDSLGSGGSLEYTGPKLFKQLRSKSNRTLITNAINHCCLSGKVNEKIREKTLNALELSEDRHLMILFRDNNCQFRALYGYHPDEEKLYKICGTGPTTIILSMIEALFKYNSGRRAFACVPSKTLSVSIDGITIKNSLWQHAKK